MATTPRPSVTSRLASIARWRSGGVFSFSLEVLTDRPGYLVLQATGRDAARAFAHEAGGHRWQRVPANDKRGRVQTSTVTVAVLREPTKAEVRLNDGDLEWKTCRGSGAGGQHRNTTDSAVQLKHVPTGISVRVESERSQHANKESALGVLRARILALEQDRVVGARNSRRKGQVGSGMRGDKRRTIRVQADQVVDHRTNKRMKAKLYLRGQIEDLWP